VLRVKGNQPTLYEGIALLFAETGACGTPVREATKRGGRLEIRELTASVELNEWAQWPHLAQVARLVTRRTRRGVWREQTHYLITSLAQEQASPARLLQLSRGHWGIENRLHWVRDVTFDEDRCQVRSGAAPYGTSHKVWRVSAPVPLQRTGITLHWAHLPLGEVP
jgi:hypothetical protein